MRETIVYEYTVQGERHRDNYDDGIIVDFTTM